MTEKREQALWARKNKVSRLIREIEDISLSIRILELTGLRPRKLKEFLKKKMVLDNDFSKEIFRG